MSGIPTLRRSLTRAEALDRGRESFHKQVWGDAFLQLSAADREAQLEPEDLQLFSIAAHLTGRETDAVDALTRAYHGFLAGDDRQSAARCAFWLGYRLLFEGELGQAGGWLARAHRLLDEGQHDCVERGYLLLPMALRSVRAGENATAYSAFVQAAATGERFGDRDLVTLALMGQGRVLIRQGEIARGVSLLDESMVAVTAGEVSAIVAGPVYCSVLEACSEIFDLRRAQEWTSALERWSASQSDLVPYRGHCLVRRAEIMQLHGAWPDALVQAQQARERLCHPTLKQGAGAACYRVAELHRLRGEFVEAEEAYRQASQWERTPQPGFAQLRLAQGQLDAANALIRHVADEVREASVRLRVLDAYVDIVLSVNDVRAARTAADELSRIAAGLHSPLVDAMSARAMGAVLLAEQDTRGALVQLRQALTAWREIKAPYEAARVRVLIALTCRNLGDRDTAELELTSARGVFEQLGATPDLARVEALLREPRADRVEEGLLTAREVEVLVLIASGRTNRSIAGELGISEKTVARHVSNIFVKLDLPSRAAATAYAYQHRLV